jgi:predicted GH43/DUF377 family glycosyl hydrolase
MATAAITLPVDPVSAAAYNAASREDKQKMQLMVRLVLREFHHSSPSHLRAVMDAIGAKATERGMTPELLEQLLDDPSDRA